MKPTRCPAPRATGVGGGVAGLGSRIARHGLRFDGGAIVPVNPANAAHPSS
jgi:hypothetical protein